MRHDGYGRDTKDVLDSAGARHLQLSPALHEHPVALRDRSTKLMVQGGGSKTMPILEQTAEGSGALLAEASFTEEKRGEFTGLEALPLDRCAPYEGFHGQAIDGFHRDGMSGHVLEDVNPYTSEVVARLKLASVADLDDAYAAAARAQLDWADSGPSQRSAVFLAAAEVMDKRHEEIVGWLIAESGSTRMKAEAGFHTRGDALGINAPCSRGWADTAHRRTGPREPGLSQTAGRGWGHQSVELSDVPFQPLDRTGAGAGQCSGGEACRRYAHYGWVAVGEDLRRSRAAGRTAERCGG